MGRNLETPARVAEIMAWPGLSPVMRPDVDTIATDSFDDDHLTTEVASFPPRSPIETAASCRHSRAIKVALDGRINIVLTDG